MKANEEYDITAAFQRIEDELIESMIRNMDRHRAEEEKEGIAWTQWQTEQLKALERYKIQNQKKYSKEFRSLNRRIEDLIRTANETGGMEQEIEILEAIKNGFRGYKRAPGTLQGEFFKLNERKLEALIKATVNDMETAETAVLRMSNDKYRRAIFDAQIYANTGVGTYEKAVDMATKDMLAAGLNCIEYANGARHTLSDYADMAIRTASKRAYLQGEGQKRQEWGVSTVIMNKRSCPCPKCLPFVGKVLIDDVWSGGSARDGPYPLMSYAIKCGLYHPRCRDSHTTYFPGISTADDTWTEKELEAVGQANRDEAKRQYAERQAEKYERLEKNSIDQEDKEKSRQKANYWRTLEKETRSDIINTGARITDPFSSEAEEFAEMYYKEIRSFSTDAKKIAENLQISVSDVRQIKAYLFEDKSLFDADTGQWKQFDPDCAIAQSWQRLMNGKDIKPHDRTLIEHELLEMRIKRDNPEMAHWEAHEIATQTYNYQKEAEEYYGNLEKHKKDGG